MNVCLHLSVITSCQDGSCSGLHMLSSCVSDNTCKLVSLSTTGTALFLCLLLGNLACCFVPMLILHRLQRSSRMIECAPALPFYHIICTTGHHSSSSLLPRHLSLLYSPGFIPLYLIASTYSYLGQLPSFLWTTVLVMRASFSPFRTVS